MPQYDYRQEARIITTETCEFTITAASQEEADRIATTMTGYDISEDMDGVTIRNATTDCNSNRLIPPEENGGRATLEIFRDDPEELLFTNMEEF